MIKIRLREFMDGYSEQAGERLTYKQLSEMTGIAPSTLASIGSRDGYSTTTKNIDAICQALGCTPCELLEYRDDSAD